MDKLVLFFKNLTVKQWVLILVILVVIAIIVIYFKNKNKETKTEEIIVVNFPLKIGSSGNEVRAIQNYILSKNPNALPVYGADGDWGSETQSAVIAIFGKSEISEADYKNIFK